MCGIMLFFCVALLYPLTASAVVQLNISEEKPLLITSDTDTVLTAEGEYVRISLMDESYLLLRPDASIRLQAGENDDAVRIELLRGILLFHKVNRSQFSLNLLVNESLVTAQSADAGVDKMGFYWVEAGQIQIMSLDSGSQVTIRKGMYAQSNTSAGEIVSGNLARAEMLHLSSSYRPAEETAAPRGYSLEYSESGELVLRKIPQMLPAGNE